MKQLQFSNESHKIGVWIIRAVWITEVQISGNHNNTLQNRILTSGAIIFLISLIAGSTPFSLFASSIFIVDLWDYPSHEVLEISLKALLCTLTPAGSFSLVALTHTTREHDLHFGSYTFKAIELPMPYSRKKFLW